MTNNPTTKATDHKLVISREFNAPRELVWKAWTTPEQIKEWLAPGEGAAIESVCIDLRVGGRYRLQQRMADGEYYTAAGTYLEVKAPERLVYTFDWEKDGAGTEFGELEGNETRMTLEFHARGDRTELVLTQEGFDSAERRDRHEGGWNSWIDRLVKFTEAKSAA
ncbi:MAG: SRPBCC domain-containing protein [Chthoniobacterales bacterium]